MLLNARRIIRKIDCRQFILLAIDDITDRADKIRRYKEDNILLDRAVRGRTKELEHKNIELESLNKDLTSFTYVSSHDLQEPIRHIRNFVSILLKDEKNKLSDEGKIYLQKTYDTAKQTQILIDDLLLYSRTKNIDRNFEKTDLSIIIEEVKKDFEDLIKQKKATIKATSLCSVNIIRFQFRQLIQNLISNSLKFSKPGIAPQINIKSEIVPGNKLKNKMLSKKIEYCHVIYTDNGIGFESQYNERIFEVFQRLHNKGEYKGTGIGLAIVKRIVENHDGIISASGNLNKGARFDIYFPANNK